MKPESETIKKTKNRLINIVLLFVIYFILFTANSFGQSITWQRVYDGVDGISDDGFDVCPADGDNIYVAGDTQFLPNRKHIYVMKLNKYGDTIWSRTINLGTPSGETAQAIAPSGDGGCVITGDADFPYSIKLDKYGNIIWNKNYSGSFRQSYRIIETSDGGYIICGRDASCSTDCAFLLKIDSEGNLQWQRTYFSTYVKIYYGIAESNLMDGYIVSGLIKNSISDTLKSLIVKIDYAGNVIWEKVYRINGASNMLSIRPLQTGYITAGNHVINGIPGSFIFVARITENGDTLFTKTIQNIFNRNFFRTIEIINHNRYVLSNSVIPVSGGPQYGNPILIDSVGNILSESVFISSDYIFLRSVLPLPNGDIVFAGTSDFDTIFTKEDIYVVRTDSMLYVPPIGIISYQNTFPEQYRVNPVYPNPFNPSAVFSFELPYSEIIKLVLYDVLGREIKVLLNEFKTRGLYKLNINTSSLSLASGVYFLRFTAESGFINTSKIVYIK